MESTGMRGNLKCAKTVIRRTIQKRLGNDGSGSHESEQDGSQGPASEEHTHTTAVSGGNVTILDSALHEGMKSLTFTILLIPFSIRT